VFKPARLDLTRSSTEYVPSSKLASIWRRFFERTND